MSPATVPVFTIVPLRAYGYSGYSSAILSGPKSWASSERSISSWRFPERFQAIALSQATESTGLHCSGL